MKKIYTLLYNFLTILKVLCPIISFLYALMWFIPFFDRTLFLSLNGPFEPFAIIVRELHPSAIIFQGEVIDMSYIISSALFIGFHYIFGFFANKMGDLYNYDEILKIRKQDREVKEMNTVIKREYEREMTNYSRFTLLFNLILNPAYDKTAKRKNEFNLLKKDFYAHLVKKISSKYKNAKGIMSDKMFLVCEDFEHFDQFIEKFVEEIKIFILENIEKDITTDFCLSIDAIKPERNIFKAMEFLEKIDSFNYKNSVIATSAFKHKYEKDINSRFVVVPIGTSRFFEEPDDFEDFELYKLKRRPAKKF